MDCATQISVKIRIGDVCAPELTGTTVMAGAMRLAYDGRTDKPAQGPIVVDRSSGGARE